MAKEFPVGTIRNWEGGDVIKAHDPVQPYSSGWIPLKTNSELELIGRTCDSLSSTIQSYKMPINGEKFLDHEIDEFVDEDGEKPFRANDFKQYFGFYGAGRYAFRNEFSKRFMRENMELSENIANALMSENQSKGGDKHDDKLSKEERDAIRKEIRSEFKSSSEKFTTETALKLKNIIARTIEQVKEGLDFKDPEKRKVYDYFKVQSDGLPEFYDKIKEKRATRNKMLEIINNTFSDNWGVRESCKDYINRKFDEYVRKYKDEISQDLLKEQLDDFGVLINDPTETFYGTIFNKYNEHVASGDTNNEKFESFKELIYLRFQTLFSKSVEGDWGIEHLPALHNLELAINELPEGHFLSNSELELLTNKDYNGGSHGGYAWYSPNERRINFSAACISKGSVFGVLSNPTEFKSVLYHEIGHAVSKKIDSDATYNYKKFAVECGWTYESKELRAGIKATGDDKDIPRTGSNSDIKLISEYSKKSPEEAFAEYYSFYSLNKKRIDSWLDSNNREFLKERSKEVCDTKTSERPIHELMRHRFGSDETTFEKRDRFNTVLTRLSDNNTHEKIELISPWNTTTSKSEKEKMRVEVATDKIRVRKNYSTDSMPPVISYRDGDKNTVIDGGVRVEVSRMNRKLVPSITISKESYFKLREEGFSDHEISDQVYYKNRLNYVPREASPIVKVHGLVHRDNLVSVNTIVSNAKILKTMRTIFHSKELEKAMRSLFSFSPLDELVTKIVDIEKSWKKQPIGTIVTHSDGKKYKKVSETGNSAKDWQLVTKDKTGTNEDSKATEHKYKPKELAGHAKTTSEENLQSAIKQSADPKIRQAAHEEIARREKEEHVQEKEEKKGESKPKVEKKPEVKPEKKKDLFGNKDLTTLDIIDSLNKKYKSKGVRFSITGERSSNDDYNSVGISHAALLNNGEVEVYMNDDAYTNFEENQKLYNKSFEDYFSDVIDSIKRHEDIHKVVGDNPNSPDDEVKYLSHKSEIKAQSQSIVDDFRRKGYKDDRIIDFIENNESEESKHFESYLRNFDEKDSVIKTLKKNILDILENKKIKKSFTSWL